MCISFDKVDSCLSSKTDDLYANRTTQSFFSATVHVTGNHLRLESLGAILLLFEFINLPDAKVGTYFLFTCFFNSVVWLHQLCS